MVLQVRGGRMEEEDARGVERGVLRIVGELLGELHRLAR